MNILLQAAILQIRFRKALGLTAREVEVHPVPMGGGQDYLNVHVKRPRKVDIKELRNLSVNYMVRFSVERDA